jgi:hypothetical protein
LDDSDGYPRPVAAWPVTTVEGDSRMSATGQENRCQNHPNCPHAATIGGAREPA